MAWTDADLAQIAALGASADEIDRQLELFRHPPRPVELLRPCAIGDGIRALSEDEVVRAPEACREARERGRLTKFVPASGAASRMFQALLAARSAGADRAAAQGRAAAGDANARALLEFAAGLPRFAFVEELRAALKRSGLDLEDLAARGDLDPVVEHLLTAKGLDYASLPKGLLSFHRYADGPRTPFEEHLVEAAGYARAADGVCRLHFTVSPEHTERFHALLARVGAAYERRFKARFEVGFSVQKASTDTLAVDLGDQPFRGADGKMLFRPGGHGALIENLNDLGGDIVFVKNIDNVVPEHLVGETIRWKQALAACLVRLQAEIFRHADALDSAPLPAAVDAAEQFARSHLDLGLPSGLDAEARRAVLLRKLDRPLRLCGVVRNTGEPGGGPFWVRGADGVASLQIVESAQVDAESPAQKQIFAASTHFNPVDLVCAVRNRRGECFDLRRFTDPSAVFIARKSSGGRDLKALERPGLWNGAMADWNTVFVEVPLATFNPVKTVLDLLRPEHQP